MRMTRKPVLPALAAAAVATAGALIQAVPVHADVTSVGGGAYGELVRATSALGVALRSGPAPAVTLPAGGGGPFRKSIASASVPGLLSTGIIVVSTQGGTVVGHTRTATSTSTVNNVNIGAGRVTASAVRATCSANGTGSTGSTMILGTNLGVSATPAPNTVVTLPGGVGRVILNEQIRTNDPGTTTSITVNAVHVILSGGALGSGNVILGHVRCQANGPDVLLDPAATGGSGGAAGVPGSGAGAGAAGSGADAAAPAEAVPGSVSFTG